MNLKFRRIFTQGTLEGISMKDEMFFVSAERAHQWVNDINAKNARGELDYRVEVIRNTRPLTSAQLAALRFLARTDVPCNQRHAYQGKKGPTYRALEDRELVRYDWGSCEYVLTEAGHEAIRKAQADQ